MTHHTDHTHYRLHTYQNITHSIGKTHLHTPCHTQHIHTCTHNTHHTEHVHNTHHTQHPYRPYHRHSTQHTTHYTGSTHIYKTHSTHSHLPRCVTQRTPSTQTRILHSTIYTTQILQNMYMSTRHTCTIRNTQITRTLRRGHTTPFLRLLDAGYQGCAWRIHSLGAALRKLPLGPDATHLLCWTILSPSLAPDSLFH